ncbi:DNA repair photolyase [Mitsuaria sp. PDC51]|uniref:PA0069 family radical SAM protein n=1 Tax=Mitsuaria sp. PDC51 TaxID=1881035 RepID=UPI0008EFC7ED|nr:PA0069 family radical SAM protein [Mitsuaria sp. PDC51]SFR74871.1 DNA repair photolyase [Mitsuaria sp. PDC51]
MGHTPSSIVQFVKGRGVGSNARSRFEAWQREPSLEHLDEARLIDGEGPLSEPSVRTEVMAREARSIISHNTSPDIPFDQSINPYAGCEHGCVYCYARPTHAYLGLSPGLDFETKLVAKTNAAELLRKELGRKGYQPSLIALGASTDPYQPIERDFRITRSILEVLAEHQAPVSITTKSALVTRDIDILGPMAERGLARVNISLATVTPDLARILDPRANAPHRRLRAMQELARAGIPVAVFASPMIPGINDADLESILEASAAAGASYASMIVLRLPLEVRDLFVEWLRQHFPLRAEHVMSLVRQMRGGVDYDSSFGSRMRGTGPYAALLRQRFNVAAKRFGLSKVPGAVDTSLFRIPPAVRASSDGQQTLF